MEKKKTDFKLGSTHIKLKVYIYIQNEKKTSNKCACLASLEAYWRWGYVKLALYICYVFFCRVMFN